MIKYLNSPQAVAAIVAAITSLATLLLTLLTKNFIEKKFLSFKLDIEHKFEERKKIKSVLAVYKSHLLTSCEDLNNRVGNFSKQDYLKYFKLLDVKGNYTNPKDYFFHSFIYRILAVYAWMNKIETELIHLDTTIATRNDLEFIKFMRFYRLIFSETDFFKGHSYGYGNQRDHITKNIFEDLYQCVIKDNEIISFNKYLEKFQEKHHQKQLLPFYQLLDGINLEENRLRWQWFQILKILNIVFLNSYGYDYQQISDEKMLIAINNPQRSKLYDNFIFLLGEYKLNKQKEIERLIKLLRKKQPITKKKIRCGKSIKTYGR